uniref:Uncharacterized protein n=1 Tax=Anguilla anguilla TaxID=7936 RepID=A0A0E9REB5_ANGAN
MYTRTQAHMHTEKHFRKCKALPLNSAQSLQIFSLNGF